MRGHSLRSETTSDPSELVDVSESAVLSHVEVMANGEKTLDQAIRGKASTAPADPRHRILGL